MSYGLSIVHYQNSELLRNAGLQPDDPNWFFTSDLEIGKRTDLLVKNNMGKLVVALSLLPNPDKALSVTASIPSSYNGLNRPHDPEAAPWDTANKETTFGLNDEAMSGLFLGPTIVHGAKEPPYDLFDRFGKIWIQRDNCGISPFIVIDMPIEPYAGIESVHIGTTAI